MRRWFFEDNGERGATLLWVALMATAFIGMLGLVLDGSYGLAQRRHMQIAADAAALGGARQLALGASWAQIEAEIAQLTTANGANNYGWSLLDGNRTVEVTARMSIPTFFAQVIGRPQMTVTATARASIISPSRSGGLMPMAVKSADYQMFQEYTLWADDPESPGNFGWLDWNGVPVDNTQLAQNITTPDSSGVWSIGQWVPAGPGVQNSSGVNAALNLWMNRHVTVPLYDQVQGTGSNTQYRIAGFGEFVLTDYSFTGDDKYVRGRFIRWAEASAGTGGGPEHGLYDVSLTM